MKPAKSKKGDHPPKRSGDAKKSTGPEYRNRRAFFEYVILEKVEAGLVLMGSEVKSIRGGQINLSDSYARVSDGEVHLVNCHIAEYKNAGAFGHEPLRARKLLLKRAEIRKLEKRTEEKGLTVIPLRLYFSARGIAKVELGIGKGKQHGDKRQATKERELDREIRREMSRY
ncbi:MAG TPA: SsrA-binding protein SmpB [Planctomycetota bacterium]|nr:SsrA-binding protein SmpB [Planctomycetota bacterium]